MEQFLQGYLTYCPSHMVPIVEDMLGRMPIDIEQEIIARRALRDGFERFSVDYQTQWSILTYTIDIRDCYTRSLSAVG